MPDDEILWALHIDDRGWPTLAHKIVDPPVAPPDGDWPSTLQAACGREFTSAHHRGWWSCKPGGLPLQPHAIHCD